MAIYRGTDLNGETKTFGGSKTPSYPKADEVVEMVDLVKEASKKSLLIRPIGSAMPVLTLWVSVEPNKKNSKAFPVPVYNIDLRTGQIDYEKENKWLRLLEAERQKAKQDNSYIPCIRLNQRFVFNAIVRADVDEEADYSAGWSRKETESGFKDIENRKSQTPVRCVSAPITVYDQLVAMKDDNVHKVRIDGEVRTRAISIFHEKYGRDISIRYNADAKTPALTYTVSARDDISPLSAEEQEYLNWDLGTLVREFTEDEIKTLEEEYKNYIRKHPHLNPDGEDDEPVRKSKSGRYEQDDDEDPPAKKRRPARDDDGLDDDEPAPKKKRPPVDDDEFGDDEPVPKKKRAQVDDDDAPPPKKKRPPVDDEFGEDEPAPKKKRPVDDDEDTPPPKKKRPPVDDEFGDDEPAPKKKRPAADDDGFEDEPAPKKRKPPVDDEFGDDEPAPKKKRPADDDGFDDEPAPKKKRPADDEDEPAPKKKRPAPVDDDEF